MKVFSRLTEKIEFNFKRKVNQSVEIIDSFNLQLIKTSTITDGFVNAFWLRSIGTLFHL